MKTLAVIGASYLQRPLVEKAKAMGLKVICFAWADGAVCAEIADRFYPLSIIEKDEILSICKEEDIDGICTIASDTASPTVAYVAEKLGLPGNSFEASIKANDKFLMREAFSKAGINCPRYLKIDNAEDALSIDWSFPVIVKPCDRSGSLGVTKAKNIDQLLEGARNAIELSFKHKAIVEDYIDGREVSVEFISHSGAHYPLTVTDKVTTGAPHFVELEHHQPAVFSDNCMFERLYSRTRFALDALGITDGASHTEYRITDNGDIYIIELGARMGGDFIGSDLVRLSTGYDYVQGVIQVALGFFSAPKFTLNKCSGVYFLCKETDRLIPYFESEGSVIEDCIIDKKRTSAVLKKVLCSGDRSGYIIYQGDRRIVI